MITELISTNVYVLYNVHMHTYCTFFGWPMTAGLLVEKRYQRGKINVSVRDDKYNF